ncbi:bublin coiled-coil protein [Nematostella vectensis]|uniref:bublin coiled-coil protein n=1 Tax=Nematostella vectensis TaxID=45351 RepID=UPI00138FD2A5|nr:bublin coiled-coil protein [Nematostella vectensis]
MADGKEELTNGDLSSDLYQKTDLNISEEDYEALDDKLDQLNTCLDKLENWNDSLNSRMREFLEDMQKSRQSQTGEASESNKGNNEQDK